MSHVRPLPGEDDPEAIRDGVRAVRAPFDADDGLERDDTGAFPRDFHRARHHHAPGTMAAAGLA